MYRTPPFADHFSGHASSYQQFRPSYPDELFAYLATLTSQHNLAWDCATGNGQAAMQLTPYFRQIVATDASAQQIAHATAHPNITYRVATAENSGLASQSVDLITVAQALHWFDTDAFASEAKRVLQSGGLIAAWSYNLLQIDPCIDHGIEHLYRTILQNHWPKERQLVEDGYHSIALPGTSINAPAFTMHAKWSIDDLLGYLNTWSAVQKYQQATHTNPVSAISRELRHCWGTATYRHITWPITLRIWKR